MRLAVKTFLAALLLVGAAYLFVFPARTYLAQKHQIALQERTISVLRAENTKLSGEKKALQDSSTIEQLARQDYGLVKPGQQAYMVLPPAYHPVRHVAAPAPKPRPWYAPLEFWDHL